jgi:hypothetical protein
VSELTDGSAVAGAGADVVADDRRGSRHAPRPKPRSRTPTAVPDAVVARHEAGHAVAAYWLKRPITRLSIEPDAETLGRIVLRTSRQRLTRVRSGVVRPEDRRQVENDVITLLAGGVAAPGAGSCELDHDLAAALVTAVSGSVEEAEAYATWLRRRAIDLIRLAPSQLAVASLTDLLVQRRTLDGGQAHDAVHDRFMGIVSGSGNGRRRAVRDPRPR